MYLKVYYPNIQENSHAYVYWDNVEPTKSIIELKKNFGSNITEFYIKLNANKLIIDYIMNKYFDMYKISDNLYNIKKNKLQTKIIKYFTKYLFLELSTNQKSYYSEESSDEYDSDNYDNSDEPDNSDELNSLNILKSKNSTSIELSETESDSD